MQWCANMLGPISKQLRIARSGEKRLRADPLAGFREGKDLCPFKIIFSLFYYMFI